MVASKNTVTDLVALLQRELGQDRARELILIVQREVNGSQSFRETINLMEKKSRFRQHA